MSDSIAIASDHGGRQLKQKIIELLQSLNLTVQDFGVPPDDPTSVDYPDFALQVAQAVAGQKVTKGILVCGTGIGMSIAANKVQGIRAALIWDEFTARMSRAHNNANILCLGERVVNHDRALDFVKIWLETPFEGDRHQRRLDKIHSLESDA
ncbi:MAG: ribose 5-phosphate isomerase B [Oligoflexus sp.]